MPNSKKLLCFTYFALSIFGAILPTLANIDFIQIYGPGFDIVKFIELANVNPAAQSLSRDLMVSSFALTIWIFTEARRLQMRHLWVVILSTFTIAFAFSAPLFLLLRERRLIEMEREGAFVEVVKT